MLATTAIGATKLRSARRIVQEHGALHLACQASNSCAQRAAPATWHRRQCQARSIHLHDRARLTVMLLTTRQPWYQVDCHPTDYQAAM
jgi:hypothetical protein